MNNSQYSKEDCKRDFESGNLFSFENQIRLASKHFYPNKDVLSYKDLCEIISKKWNEKEGLERHTGNSVFNYSLKGELFNIPFWFIECYLEDTK